MITKNQLKYYSSLLDKKTRKLEKKFITEGYKLVLEGLNSPYKCAALFIVEEVKDKYSDVIHLAKKKHTEIFYLNNHDFEKLSETVNSQGVAAAFIIPNNNLSSAKNDKLIICLDNVSDPGNVGTIIRTCDWFGINSIVLSTDSADLYNGKTIRSSMGSIFHINAYQHINLFDFISEFKAKDFKIYITDLDGNDYTKINLSDKSIIIFSNEANGPDPKLSSIIDGKLTIKQKGKAESLNVAVAAGIIISKFA
ncbi:MAG TPA: RNA methyltransferase [Ignavibacteriaceae bacterium]|nr:RNA methyltransferase [Ignavibacteriaceae bacterium]